ncbi:MAG TPA: C4-dicarboxylate ABC transporter substrate-binding protein, partial [Burkholderiales bacterium]|nr:C4-dicarboxylate ABC transporter substrate-binding protein [Burkholderiales bacterium]
MKAASFRDIALIVLPIALLLGLAAFLVAKFVQPAPPRVVVMSTGSADGAYHAFAERYRAQLAKYGIRLELKPSAGSVENLARLRAGTDGVSVALLQGGIAGAEGATGLMTLGSVFYEPLWCFYRGAAIPLGTGLRGRRIAVGVPGSG